MNYSHYSDETLLKLITQQNEEAFEEFYQRHKQVVFNLIVRIVGDRTFADAILQESFFQAWKKADDYRGVGAAAAWLYRIARKKSLDAARQNKQVPVGQSTGRIGYQNDPYLPFVESTRDPLWNRDPQVEQTLTRQIDHQSLKELLASIPEEQLTCLELAYFEGYSQGQISAVLGVPLGTVKNRIRLGLEKLEYILQATGYNEQYF